MSLKRIPCAFRQLGAVVLVITLLGVAVPTLAQGDTPTPRPTRTPLPSVTPEQDAPPGLPTGTPGPTATLAVASPLPGPTATSPLLAASPTPLVSPVPTQPLVLPGDAPPFGINLFVVKAITGRTMATVVYGCIPYYGLMLGWVALLMAFPGIVLWLPARM